MNHKLSIKNVHFFVKAPKAIDYKGIKPECSDRLDFLMGEWLILELKSVENIESSYFHNLINIIPIDGRFNLSDNSKSLGFKYSSSTNLLTSLE